MRLRNHLWRVDQRSRARIVFTLHVAPHVAGGQFDGRRMAQSFDLACFACAEGEQAAVVGRHPDGRCDLCSRFANGDQTDVGLVFKDGVADLSAPGKLFDGAKLYATRLAGVKDQRDPRVTPAVFVAHGSANGQTCFHTAVQGGGVGPIQASAGEGDDPLSGQVPHPWVHRMPRLQQELGVGGDEPDSCGARLASWVNGGHGDHAGSFQRDHGDEHKQQQRERDQRARS